MLGSVEVWLPALNAALIVISGAFLLVGYGFIRSKRVLWHRRCMIAATVFAALFLVVYLSRAALLPTKFFPGEGAIRVLYFAVLISHTIIAMLVGPFVLVTLRRAFAGRFAQHRRVARITVPLWAYTAVTGWVVYVLLYHVT
jgi:putative membrane protein